MNIIETYINRRGSTVYLQNNIMLKFGFIKFIFVLTEIPREIFPVEWNEKEKSFPFEN